MLSTGKTTRKGDDAVQIRTLVNDSELVVDRSQEMKLIFWLLLFFMG